MSIANNITDITLIKREKLREFQGKLKKDRPDLIDKLSEEILARGFNLPIAIWVNHPEGTPLILDGHQRLKALDLLAEQGKTLKDDEIPTVGILAENDADAWQKVLEYNSRHSEIDQEFLAFVIESHDLDTENIVFDPMHSQALEDDLKEKYDTSGEEVDLDSMDDIGKIEIELLSADYIYAMKGLKIVASKEGTDNDGQTLCFLLEKYGVQR